MTPPSDQDHRDENYGRPLRPIPAALDGLDELMGRVEAMEKRFETFVKPILDFIQALQQHGIRLRIFGKSILTLEVGKPDETRGGQQ